MGARVGISAKYRTGIAPFIRKKNQILSLVMSIVCARRKYTSIFFYRLCISFPLLIVMCNLVWNSTCIGLFRHPVPSWLDRWHPGASWKYPLLEEWVLALQLPRQKTKASWAFLCPLRNTITVLHSLICFGPDDLRTRTTNNCFKWTCCNDFSGGFPQISCEKKYLVGV